MKLCICFGIGLSLKWFLLRLSFFVFSNLGLIIAQQTSIYINCFMAGGWHTCHPISKMHIMGEGPSETPSALKCRLSDYSFLTDIKQLAKTSKGGTLRAPSDVCFRSFSVPFHFNKTPLHESSWVIKPGPWSWRKIFRNHQTNTIHCKLSVLPQIYPFSHCHCSIFKKLLETFLGTDLKSTFQIHKIVILNTCK